MSVLRAKQAKFWYMVAQLLIKAVAMKTPVTILCWLRTEAEQRLMVARGASKTMKTKHLQGLAVDICFVEDLNDDGIINYPTDKYLALGEFWESIGGRWGGRFGESEQGKGDGWDCGHMEYKD